MTLVSFDRTTKWTDEAVLPWAIDAVVHARPSNDIPASTIQMLKNWTTYNHFKVRKFRAYGFISPWWKWNSCENPTEFHEVFTRFLCWDYKIKLEVVCTHSGRNFNKLDGTPKGAVWLCASKDFWTTEFQLRNLVPVAISACFFDINITIVITV